MIEHPAEESRMPTKIPHTETQRIKIHLTHLQDRATTEAAGGGQNKEGRLELGIREMLVASPPQAAVD
jgi:hypothetical protein